MGKQPDVSPSREAETVMRNLSLFFFKVPLIHFHM